MTVSTLEEAGDKVFKIKMGGKMEKVTVDRFKPHVEEAAPPAVAVQPEGGRPPLAQ